MMTSKDLLFQIKIAMLYKDVLQKDIAEKTGINLRTLQRRFMKPEDFTLDELIKISEMLGIKFEFIYNTTPTREQPEKIRCPYCGSYNVKLTNASTLFGIGYNNLYYRFLCKDCHKDFTRPAPTSPYITMVHSRQNCEGCYIYEQIKKGEPVVTDACTFCGANPNKITCEAKNNDKQKV